MRHHKTRSIIPYISISGFIISIVNAQDLVGCDAVSCPTTYRQAHCTVGNTTLSELGITSFNTSLDISPFIWTLGIQEIIDPANSSRALWDRNYFLGTPPSVVDLTSSSRGCALFFDGISADLSFPGVDRSTTVGSCQDALSSLCVNDLLSQSQSQILSLMKDSKKTQTELNICAELQSALQSQAPASCDAVASHDWGTIIVRGT
ncbi:hypothetical protein EAE99_008781 [Botrytis elliptica]|nr:hypothetical protein EAE99_008781 [Botrytis elliptica]